jgi:photosystem II cytochrome c550
MPAVLWLVHRLRQVLLMLGAIALCWSLAFPAQAAVDPFIRRYFDADTPVALPINAAGDLKRFTAEQFTAGKAFFSSTCINCHVGGTTLPNPPESLALATLQGATPPRDTIAALVAFMRQPMTYDGQDVSFSCRAVSERWLPDEDAEAVAAFILRAAQNAPGWGTQDF